MKIAELKALIHDLPDDADICPTWANGPPGDSDPAVVLRGFRLGDTTGGTKPWLAVLVDIQYLDEARDPQEIADDLHDERVEMAEDALGKSTWAHEISTGDDDWTVKGDNFTKSLRFKSGNAWSVRVVFEPGTDTVLKCELYN
jgi:hypothetical protein